MKNAIIISILFLPIILSSQSSSETQDIRDRIETAVDQGLITREQAEERFARYRERLGQRNNLIVGKSEQKTDILTNYKKLGVNNLSRIKKSLSNNGIPDNQLDGVLRGMLRLIHVAKSDENNYEMNPRMRNYFEDRIGLDPKQVQYVMNLSVRIAKRVK